MIVLLENFVWGIYFIRKFEQSYAWESFIQIPFYINECTYVPTVQSVW